MGHALVELSSVPEWDRQFRLIRVHHEHCELAGFDLPALALTRFLAAKVTSPESEQVHLCP
jgi:hypothetical protein